MRIGASFTARAQEGPTGIAAAALTGDEDVEHTKQLRSDEAGSRLNRPSDRVAPVGANNRVAAPGSSYAVTRWLWPVIRLPLLWKLIVLDLVISLLTYGVTRNAAASQQGEIITVALVVTLALNAGVVYWALLPLRRLEDVATRVAQGAFDARVPAFRSADRDIARIGGTINQLLDIVLADRARVRSLAAQVIRAGDQERAYISRELHDSTAQSLGALDLLLAAALRESQDPATAHRLALMQSIVDETWRDVRTLSHTIHPRVLDDLGLTAALEWLARRTREETGIAASVSAVVTGAPPVSAASVLYRVAQEAVRNAVRHANPTHIEINLAADDEVARLVIADDGCGFDVHAGERARSGMGLFIMRERLELLHGQLEITSRPGAGTKVQAAVPLTTHMAS